MDFYVVLIADTPNLNNFHLEFFRQPESLGTGQLLSAVRGLSVIGGLKNSINYILLFGHLCFSTNPSMRSVRLLSSMTGVTQRYTVVHCSAYPEPRELEHLVTLLSIQIYFSVCCMFEGIFVIGRDLEPVSALVHCV
jgi:hypothetical protein